MRTERVACLADRAAGQATGLTDESTPPPDVLTYIDGTSALASGDLLSDLPVGLPFIGDAVPPCADPRERVNFEVAGTLHDATTYVRACKRTCTACPYVEPCKEWAIVNRERWSVWGGLTPRERTAERRRRGMTRG